MLEAKGVVVGYKKDIHILQGVSIRAREAQITAVLGPNGVGKSTLLKTIYGYLKPSEGGIIFKGSGFYATDYRSDAYKKKAQEESPSSKTAGKDSSCNTCSHEKTCPAKKE